MRALRIGSRGSALALWQANFIREKIEELSGEKAEIVRIRTSGDRFASASVGQMGLKGVFIKELEDALLDGQIDLAVHSMKDVPTVIPKGLEIAATAKREEVRDCLIAREGRRLAELPRGARVGTSSLRRQSQLRHHRPDLDLRNLRGNVDTRLRKLEEGEFDAIVVAKAGLDRLGASAKIAEILPPEVMLPAVGQGALGIEACAADQELLSMLGRLDHAETRAAVSAERALLAQLEGGCQVPLGAWARVEGGQLRLEACVLSADGSEYLRCEASGSLEAPEALGGQLARALLEAGAGRILRLAGRALGNG